MKTESQLDPHCKIANIIKPLSFSHHLTAALQQQLGLTKVTKLNCHGWLMIDEQHSHVSVLQQACGKSDCWCTESDTSTMDILILIQIGKTHFCCVCTQSALHCAFTSLPSEVTWPASVPTVYRSLGAVRPAIFLAFHWPIICKSLPHKHHGLPFISRLVQNVIGSLSPGMS